MNDTQKKGTLLVASIVGIMAIIRLTRGGIAVHDQHYETTMRFLGARVLDGSAAITAGLSEISFGVFFCVVIAAMLGANKKACIIAGALCLIAAGALAYLAFNPLC